MNHQQIIYAEDAGIATITLNRPQAYNALCAQMNSELMEVLDRLEEDAKIRVLIIGGANNNFAAGADIVEMMDATPFEAERTAETAHKINDRLESLKIPVIAAINGLALGGGFELALSCDFRIAGENSVFGLPETGLGIIPGAGGTQRLTRLIGPVKAKEIIMLGRRINGQEAYEMGIVNKVVPDGEVMAEARKMAARLMEKPAAALALAKMAIGCCLNHDISSGKLYERSLFSLSFASSDQKEGMKAFVEKRVPRYNHER
ncbi:MAG: enoyl-CoA hydratase/isomerase family protein [Peptococcaceae bacterium]|jgi:enoyl-CoA hydratase|nr:enoyl-CoA hydratase/isomerase family protein [Peptococcaceae bacterium]MDH7525435.1 enoyl-CoA hydratase/isomerase family protein [Peptococcaceae bacterium]